MSPEELLLPYLFIIEKHCVDETGRQLLRTDQRLALVHELTWYGHTPLTDPRNVDLRRVCRGR